jgi:hypothetical protein
MTAFYHSVQNTLSSKLMFKTINTIYAEIQFFTSFYTGVKRGLRGISNERLKTLQNEELLLSSPNITRVIKLRRMTKARHVARTGGGGGGGGGKRS